MTASDCIPAEEMALLIGGKARRRDRKRWLSHLDTCLDCRTVLAGAASYVEETATDEKRSLWDAWFDALQSRALAAGLAVLLIGLVTVVATDPLRWFGGGNDVIARISTTTATAPLLSVEGTSHTDNRWVSQERGLGFSSAIGPRERAFRAGVYLVDLRIAIREGRIDDAVAVLTELETLGVAGTAQISLVTYANPERRAGAIDELESDARHSLDEVFFALGIWSQAGRLAARAGEADFFRGEQFVTGLEAFRNSDLPSQIARRLDAIHSITSEDFDPRQLPQLENELRQLILLN